MATPPFRRGNERKRTTAIVLALFLLWSLIAFCCAARVSPSGRKDKISNFLRRLNKPALKTFQTKYGDTIDCVHINKQPAFDNPLLRSYKFQTEPTSPRFLNESNVSGRIKHQMRKHVSCPNNTVPIRRTTADDVLRASSITHFGKRNYTYSLRATLDSRGNHEYAIAYLGSGQYYGVRGHLNTWKPYVEAQSEISVSQIWVLGGDFQEIGGYNLDTVEVGWQVNQKLFGDTLTRLFVYWTSDNYQTEGCYNLVCSGFVQTSKKYALGMPITPLSKYRGAQYELQVSIYRDTFGNWVVSIGKEVLGFFPSKLFPRLRNFASMIEMGGEVSDSRENGRHTLTQMGSGYFAAQGFKQASYFNQIQVLHSDRKWREPGKLFTQIVPGCYDIHVGKYDPKWGAYFYYGGPGGWSSSCK